MRALLQFALRKLLKPFAWAHAPLEHRVAELKPPVTFIYGENDWMDPDAAQRICDTLSTQPTASGNGADVPHNRKVLFIEDTGHFAFLERPEEFNELLLEVVRHCLPEGDAAAAGGKARASGEHHGAPLDESDQGVSLGAIEAAFVDT